MADGGGVDAQTRQHAPTETREPSGPGIPAWVFVVVVVLAAVLRLIGLGSAGLSADESYTVVASDRSVVDVVSYIGETDPHPPLSYLLEQPVVQLSSSRTVVRLVPAICSIAAVAVMAVWQRREGFGGLVATALLAVAPEQLIFGRQARMYGLMVLCGVVAAWASSRWIEQGSRRWAWTAAGAGLAAGLAHSTGFILPVCLLLVPGLRRDRDAWWFRWLAADALVVVGLVFGPTALDRVGSKTFYPRPTPDWIATVLNEQLAPLPERRWLIVTLLVVGALLVIRRRSSVSRVWLCLFLVPLVGLGLMSLRSPVLIPKTVLMLSWGIMLALGAIADEAWRWRRVAGGLTALLLLVAVVPWVGQALDYDEGSDGMVVAVADRVSGGDVVAVRPANLGTLVEWHLGRVEGHQLEVVDLGLPETTAWSVDGGGADTGRIWLVEAPGRISPLEDELSSCGDVDEPVGGGFVLSCIETPRRDG